MSKKRYSVRSSDTFIKKLHPKNSAQDYYLNTIKESTVTFSIGPAGTGKTHLATYIALNALINDEVDKIILTRPIVAVEDIGYLPGNMDEKIHPYILPLLDSLEIHLGPTKTRDMISDGKIEVIPLAYMRGRSLNRSFLILDEAQNTTKEQIKMFLTRLGYDSKMVITGDASQSDLPKNSQQGLSWAKDMLSGRSEEISVVEFYPEHIVRNPLIETMLRYLNI